jgi:hypothetical protein
MDIRSCKQCGYIADPTSDGREYCANCNAYVETVPAVPVTSAPITLFPEAFAPGGKHGVKAKIVEIDEDD